jgi:C2 domain
MNNNNNNNVIVDAEAFNVLGLVASQSSGKSGHGLRVNVIEARDIRPTTYFATDKSDSYAEVSLLGERAFARTTTIRDTLNPQFGEHFNLRLSLAPMNDVVDVTLKGVHSVGRDDFIGRVIVPVSLILKLQGTKTESCWLKLLPGNASFQGGAGRHVTGSIRLGFEYFFEPNDAQRAFLAEQQMGVALAESRRSAGIAPDAAPAVRQQQQQQQEQQQHRDMAMAMSLRQQQQQQRRPPSTVGMGSPPAPGIHYRAPMPQQPRQPGSACPVCSVVFASSALAAHVDSHFPQQQPQQRQALQQQSQQRQQQPQVQYVPPSVSMAPIVKQQHQMPAQPTLEQQEARMLAAALAASEREARQQQQQQVNIVATSPAPLSSSSSSASSITSNEVRVVDELRDRLQRVQQRTPEPKLVDTSLTAPQQEQEQQQHQPFYFTNQGGSTILYPLPRSS